MGSDFNPRVQIKIEQIARLRIAGIKDSTIAVEMNMSYSGLQRILATTQYLEYEAEVRRGQLVNMDGELAKRTELIHRKQKEDELRKKVADALPDAIQNILDAVKQKRDLKTALAASRDVIKLNSRVFDESTGNGNRDSASPQVPESVLNDARAESDRTSEMLLRVPMQTPANA